MSTTLSLDDDVFRKVKAYAESLDVAIGKAVSELVRRGLHAPLRTRLVNGFHVVELPPGSPPVSSEDVERLQDELECKPLFCWTSMSLSRWHGPPTVLMRKSRNGWRATH